MTHPFHPWSGREFEFAGRRRCWDLDRVYFYGSGGELACLPAEWTDAVPADPFVLVAAGRVPFRTGDLLAVAELVSGVGARQAGGGTADVREIMPWVSA